MLLRRRNPGPQTSQELGCWDKKLAGIMASTELGPRALRLLQHGALVYSDYSGYDSPRECLRVAMPTLCSEMQSDPVDILFTRSCDWGKDQQQVLKHVSTSMDDGRSCVFRDINDRLHNDVKAWIDEAAPSTDSKLTKSDAIKANQTIQEFLEKNRSWALLLNCTSWCSVHHRPCPVYPLWAWRMKAAGRVDRVETLCKEAGLSRFSPRLSSSSLKLAERRPWWLQHTGNTPACKRRRQSLCDFVGGSDNENDDSSMPATEPLAIVTAGLTCTDYSPLGPQLRDGGTTERHHAVWVHDRKAAAAHNVEDLAFFENSDRYPADAKMSQALTKTHTVVFIKTSPEDLGHPVKRRRTFGVAINKQRVVWVGPEIGDVKKNFDDLFGSSLALDGDAYFVASQADVNQMAEEMARRRKRKLAPNFEQMPMTDYFTSVLAPGALLRHTEYDQVRLRTVGPNEPHLADLEQHGEYGQKGGRLMPVLATHPTIFSWVHQRVAHPKELFFAQGLDMYSHTSGGRGVSPLAKILARLPTRSSKVLCGNAMHVPTYATWMLYVLGNCRRVSDFCRLEVPLCLHPVCYLYDDDPENDT